LRTVVDQFVAEADFHCNLSRWPLYMSLGA
jgi:hypothetical protein